MGNGWPEVVIGLPFAAAGIVVALMAAGVVAPPAVNLSTPKIVLAFIGISFFSIGTFISLRGLGAVRRTSRVREIKFMHPFEPWFWDFPWDPQGIGDNGLERMLRSLVFGILFAVFLVPFNMVVFQLDAQAPFLAKIIVGIFDFITAFIFGVAGYRMLQLLKYGTGRIRYGCFPFHLGEKLEVHFSAGARIGKFKEATIILRCVEERCENFGSETNQDTQTACYQLYADTQAISGAEQNQGSEWALCFPLPQGNYGTRLSESPLRYWELEIKAATPGVDYGATFLLPVYGKPG